MAIARGSEGQSGRDDDRPLLNAAGFVVDAYDETENGRERQQRTAEGLLANIGQLAIEEGSTVAQTRAEIDEMVATFTTMSRRFLVVTTAR